MIIRILLHKKLMSENFAARLKETNLATNAEVLMIN